MFDHLPPVLPGQLPAPLHNRHTTNDILIGLFIAPHIPQAQVIQVCAAVRAWASLPVRIALIHPPSDGTLDVPDVPPARWASDADAPDCTHYRAQGDEYTALLARLEGAWLPDSLAHPYQRQLAQLYVPTVVTMDAPPLHPPAGLALEQPSPQDIAATLVLLVSDPPTRRRTLDAQRPLRRPDTARTWRVEGLFDSSYSLAIVNRQLALALQDCGAALDTPPVPPTSALAPACAPPATPAQSLAQQEADQRAHTQLRHALQAANRAQHEARSAQEHMHHAQEQAQQVQEQLHHAQEQLQQVQAQLQQTQAQTQHAQAHIHALHASLSWRITAPLRWGLGMLMHPITQARSTANHVLFHSVETLQRPLATLMAGVLRHPELSHRLGHWLLTRYPHLHGQLTDVAYRSGVLRSPVAPHSAAAYHSTLATHTPQAQRIYAALQSAVQHDHRPSAPPSPSTKE